MTRRLLLICLLAFAAHVAPAGAAVRDLNVVADVKLRPGGGATLRQSGTFRGTPFGKGQVRTSTTIGRGRGMFVRFTFVTRRGTVSGTGDCRVDFRGDEIIYTGTAKVTGGTGAYRRARASRLRFTGRTRVSSDRFSARLSGRIRL